MHAVVKFEKVQEQKAVMSINKGAALRPGKLQESKDQLWLQQGNSVPLFFPGYHHTNIDKTT